MPVLEASELQTICRGEDWITACYPSPPTAIVTNTTVKKKKLKIKINYKSHFQRVTEEGS